MKSGGQHVNQQTDFMQCNDVTTPDCALVRTLNKNTVTLSQFFTTSTFLHFCSSNLLLISESADETRSSFLTLVCCQWRWNCGLFVLPSYWRARWLDPSSFFTHCHHSFPPHAPTPPLTIWSWLFIVELRPTAGHLQRLRSFCSTI